MPRTIHRSALLKLIAFLLLTALLVPAVPVAALPADGEDGVKPITISVAAPAVIEDGRTWIDAEGLHVRALTTVSVVEEDLTGEATLTTDLDWFGPCHPDSLACEGAREAFSQVEITGEAGTWTGTLALETAPDQRAEAHGILIGRHGTNQQVIVIDEVVSADAGSIDFGGSLVTLTGPIGGVHLTGSACITGPTTADGGFIGTRGLILDNGPLRVERETVGGQDASGIYGELRQIGQKGSLRGLFIATLSAGHAHGEFVLLGESGPYAGLLGYGRATATVTGEPRCQSGLQVTSTWTGQARYFTDPADFLAPRVFFSSPTHGATVTNPITLELVAEHVTIEPAGDARDGTGHLTIIVDAPCLGPGEPMPTDDQHIQLVEGETSHELNLLTGEHRLCLQLTSGDGIAQPATDVITIFVAPSGGGERGNF